MIETKEQYEAITFKTRAGPAMGSYVQELISLVETIEALREVVRGAQRVWETVPSVRGPDDHPEVQKHAVALNDLKQALDDCADWITE